MQILQREILRALQGVIENALDESDIDINYDAEAPPQRRASGLIAVQHLVSWACFMTIAFSFSDSAVSFEVKTARRGEDDRPVENLVVKITIDLRDNQVFASFYSQVAAELRDSELYDMGNPYA